MPRIRIALTVLIVLALGGAAVAFASPGQGENGDHRDGHDGKRGRVASATLLNAAGEEVGDVWMREDRRSGGVLVFARVRDLPPGFHGFHIHTTGLCEAPGFTTAGGHFNPADTSHGAHAGDLPSLLVTEDGTAILATATDRFSLDDLRDDDGSAVIVHAGPDNFANIPPRYGTPDEDTLATGDAGSRLACGVVD
jgi:Cu-Zn family superoxide dismutase